MNAQLETAGKPSAWPRPDALDRALTGGLFRVRRRVPQASTVADAVQLGRPAIVHGLAAGWPAVSGTGPWTFESLAARLEGQSIPVRRWYPHDEKGINAEKGSGPLAEAGATLRAIGANAEWIQIDARLDTLPATPSGALGADIGAVPGFEAVCEAGAATLTRKLWVSRAGHATTLHWDLPHNLNTTLVGRKRFVLMAPQDALWLSPALPPARYAIQHSTLDLLQPEAMGLAARARLGHVAVWVGEVGPGETIYMPPLWWHHVTTLEPTLGVSHFWGTGALAQVMGLSHRIKTVLGLWT